MNKQLCVVSFGIALFSTSICLAQITTDGAILCPVKPLDKSANANGQRRRLSPADVDLSPLPPKGLPALMTQLLADYAATGLPPAYLPTHTTHTTNANTDEVSS
jgi:hypothetical protein